MKGIQVKKFGGVEEMTLSDTIPIPQVNQNEVLICIKSSGVNPVDTYIREGNFSVLPSLPYTPGKDGAGIVDKVGSNVTKFKVGDRVFCSQPRNIGTLAEYSSMSEDHVFPLDDKMSFDEGASLPIPYFTAHRALIFKAKAQKGSKVLIHGASGAVGLACVQLAKSLGMSVVGTAGTQEGMDLVRSVGADSVYNHRVKKYVDQIHADHPEKFNAIIEMLSNANLQNDLSLMGRNGVTVVVGCRGDIKISPRLLMGPESSIIGCALLASPPEELKASADAILRGIQEGWVKPVIAKTYPLSEAGQAHHDIIHSKGALGKLIVKVAD